MLDITDKLDFIIELSDQFDMMNNLSLLLESSM